MDDGHPIPQDITGFQFRLIGDMTIKQFAYLLGGWLLAWLFFSLPIFFIIKIPLAIFFGFLGVLLAFIPIQGRPAETMLMLFAKSLFHPNEYVKGDTKKAKETTATPGAIGEIKPTEKKQKKNEKIFFQSSPQVSSTKIEEPISETVQESPKLSVQFLEDVAPAPKIDSEEEAVNSNVATLTKELAEAQTKEQLASVGSADAEEAHEKVIQLQDSMQEILSQKEDLERQLIQLKQQLEKKPKQIFSVAEAVEAQQTTQNVKKVPQPLTKSAGTPFTPDVPNVITGVVKDPRGNVLPNILVEVKDKDDNPVRAFKTNSLGQFASATPLLNGTYTVMFDDPKKLQSFDTIELVVDGTILQPFEVISIDARETLRKSLFTS